MPEYTLKIRRYDPTSGEPPYWDTHTVDLSPRPVGARRDPQDQG